MDLSATIGRRDSLRQTRFNLLLLEDGEYFLEDYSVFAYPDNGNNMISWEESQQRKLQGRLKLCTRSLIFEPKEPQLPLQAFRFRSMEALPTVDTGEALTELVKVVVSEVIEMKEKNIDHPYHVRKSSGTDKSAETTFYFELVHSSVLDFINLLTPLWEVSHEKRVLNKVDEANRLAAILEPRLTSTFDSSLLVDFRERPLLPNGMLVERIVPLLKYPGCLMLTSLRVYFQPALVNNTGNPVVNYPYSKIKRLYRRRHMLRQCGLELVMTEGKRSVFFSFRSKKARDNIYKMIMKQLGEMTKDEGNGLRQDHLEMCSKWQDRKISNYEYLLYLNTEADRTLNDLTQYPVFPWVIANYETQNFDLTDPEFFRDLSKPMGALNQSRLDYFKERFDAMPRDEEGLPPPFLYGTHYSTPGYVLFFLVRQAPEYMLCLQNGKFDSPDRLFKSVRETWKSCLTNHADLKELIPSFYETSIDANEWLRNTKSLDLGVTQKGVRVADVDLPPWALDANDFVKKNREALECDYVSNHLHEWIDLIFGCKQKGLEAEKADNCSVDLETIDDPVEKCSFEAQIQEFGQTPKQLFATSHPRRCGDIEERRRLVMASEQKPVVTPAVPKSTHDDVVVVVANPVEENKKGVFTDLQQRAGSLGKNKLVSALKTTFARPGIKKEAPKKIQPRSGGIWNWKFKSESDPWYWVPSEPRVFHKDVITSLKLSRDGRALFSTSKDTSLKILRVEDGSARRSLTCHLPLSSCCVSFDEKFAFIGSWDNNVYTYSVESGRAMDKILAHEDAVSGMAIRCDQLLTCSWDSTIKIWQINSDGLLSSSAANTFKDSSAPLKCIDINSHGSHFVAGADNGSVYLYDMKTKSLQATVPGSLGDSAVVAIKFTAHDQGASFICCSSDNSFSVYSIKGVQLNVVEAALISGEFRCMATDGKYAATGSSDGVIRFWNLDAETGKEELLRIENSTKDSITSIDIISNTGKLMATGSSSGVIKTWKLEKKPASVFHF